MELEFYSKCNRELVESRQGCVVAYLQDNNGCCVDGLWKGKNMGRETTEGVLAGNDSVLG